MEVKWLGDRPKPTLSKESLADSGKAPKPSLKPQPINLVNADMCRTPSSESSPIMAGGSSGPSIWKSAYDSFSTIGISYLLDISTIFFLLSRLIVAPVGL